MAIPLLTPLIKGIGAGILGGIQSGIGKRVDAWAAGKDGNYFGNPNAAATQLNIDLAKEQMSSMAGSQADANYANTIAQDKSHVHQERMTELRHQQEIERMMIADALYSNRRTAEWSELQRRMTQEGANVGTPSIFSQIADGLTGTGDQSMMIPLFDWLDSQRGSSYPGRLTPKGESGGGGW